ncbi:MAG: hypothetical protein ACFB6S_15175 [Geminicoccaceae bacterium]
MSVSDPASAKHTASVYGLWGKGLQPAAANLADDFAHQPTKEHQCPRV